MKYEVLSKSDCAAINDAALQVLERVGIQLMRPELRKVCKDNGCDVDDEKMIVKFPKSLVEASVKKCPRQFLIAGRDRKNSHVIHADDKSRFANFGTAVKYCTYENDKFVSRGATEADVGEAIKYVDALDNFSMGVTPISAVNLVGEPVMKDVHEQFQILMNFTKHSMADWVAVNLDYGFEFEKALCGGDEEEALKNPLYTIGAPPASPLVFDDRFANNILMATKYHMPVMAMGMVLNGATGPVYTAGSLVVATAESLATIVIAQCLLPGCAVWYGSSGTILDLKSGAPAVGSPERALISAACANMASFYGLPSFIAGPETDSKLVDVQSGHEKTLTGLLPTIADASMHFGPGMMENGIAFCPEQLMLDNDMISMMKYVANGIEVTEETLAVEDIIAVGPGGDFLALPSTLANINNQSAPELFDRQDYDAWMADKGGRDAAQYAHGKAMDIKNNYEVEPIDADIVRQLEAIVKKADATVQ